MNFHLLFPKYESLLAESVLLYAVLSFKFSWCQLTVSSSFFFHFLSFICFDQLMFLLFLNRYELNFV